MKTVMFVCTGNTCRSPMAACLFHALCKEQGISDITAESAGVCANVGETASTEAMEAMKRRGLDLSMHRARQISSEILENASLIVCMSASHMQSLREAKMAHVPMMVLEPAIADPYGGSALDYELTAIELQVQMPQLMEKLKEEC